MTKNPFKRLTCRIYGHSWDYHFYLRNHRPYATTRRCLRCGKVTICTTKYLSTPHLHPIHNGLKEQLTIDPHKENTHD